MKNQKTLQTCFNVIPMGLTLFELHKLYNYESYIKNQFWFLYDRAWKYSENHILKKRISKKKSFLFGGNGSSIYKHNIGIEFIKSKNNIATTYSIHINNDTNNNEVNDKCLIITINKGDYSNIVNINIFNNPNKCLSKNKNFILTGSALLEIGINFIKELKKKYKNINRIVIADNSLKSYKNKVFKFPILYSLINGHTWYGKYGFRPYDDVKNQPDKVLLNKYNNNLEIIKKKEIKDLKNLNIFFKEVMDKYNIEKITKEKLLNFIKNNPTEKLSTFINALSLNLEVFYQLLYEIYEKIYNAIGCYSFHGKYFYLDI